ncbi:family 43 glycosylhydrolase [Tamlana sp. 2_MG-2023]|uniref:family 43 glycosylhydrolase n=1 Tax=unclassified Tamlana TaxID=2614803 RepID=UPI0026E1B04C|nr:MULTISPECIES: family 43 glycosylhydrolase [unclassified Tamlana]MDO6761053.1 family 43 glycosylhydrolase [Tamlana sp. 2_MG-2023]MDO6791614.1 family 43 glycosylhydrolase [Tamlana sp. 1_MG-2023]
MNTTTVKISRCLLPIICLILLIGCENSVKSTYKFKRDGNPLVKHLFTADPSARVFNDRLYVYTSHDEDTATYFNMQDWHVFSTKNLNEWTDHGPIFSLNDIAWADKWAWAPDAIERNGKYYFYYPVERAKIGVAVSDSPTGPFVDKLGKPLIDNTDQVHEIGPEPIDPGLLIHDNQAYMYFGCRELRVVKLKDNMMEIDGGIMNIQIKGAENDKESEGRGWYGEGPWVFERDGKFYFTYSNGWGKESSIVYAIGDNPLGPFEYVGRVMDPVNSWTYHGSITEFQGKWYVFYHDQTLSQNGFRRSVCFDEITFDDEGKIIPLKIDYYEKQE